jgi:transposase
MGSKMAKSYSPEFREQIIKECMETNRYNVVAKKHQIPVTTVYTWIKQDKNKAKT